MGLVCVDEQEPKSGGQCDISVNQSHLRVDVSQAAALLRRGEVVAFPTETVYGLGANALNARAVARIFEVKERPTFDPLIVHIANLQEIHDLVESVPAAALQLAEEFWPGPLTLVLPKKSHVPDLVTAGLPGVGIRIPAHPVALELLRQTGSPLAAPSANKFGAISPTTAQHVIDGLGAQSISVVDGGPCAVGVESTVLSFMGPDPVVLRPGGLPIEDICRLIGPVELAVPDPDADDSAQPAPGMLSRHYAPRTKLLLVPISQQATPLSGQRTGLLTWGKQPLSAGFAQIERLSTDEDLRTCAARLFAALRTLDSADLDVIIAHQFPAKGLGVALNDRLSRASSGFVDSSS
jgi:L-threonylcarbamoyladenylate synthase